MKVKWQKLLLKTSFWLTAEVVLSLIGLDNLADYSEYIFQNRALNHLSAVVTYLMASV